MTIDSLNAAKDAYSNSGMAGWEWFEGFDEDELIEYIYRKHQEGDSLDKLVAAFLTSKGEKPSDYGI